MSRLIVIGSVNADHVLQVDAFPRPGETVTGHGYQVLPGGKGANQAVAAARLGADIGFIACVGDDAFGSRMIDAFREEGMDTSGVLQQKNTPTGIALIQVSPQGENAISIAAEANACLTPEVLKPHLTQVREAEAVLMQLETPMETIELAASEARKAGVQVVLNPAPARELPDSLLQNVTIITPNETEAEILTGIKVETEADAQKAADILHSKGVEIVLLTLGSRGAYLSSPDQKAMVKGFTVDAVDTTAAGDTFNGAFMAALQKRSGFSDAIRFAHAAAAISVTRLGAQPSIPSLDDVTKFTAKNSS